jgi:hypothetical protein
MRGNNQRQQMPRFGAEFVAMEKISWKDKQFYAGFPGFNPTPAVLTLRCSKTSL